MIRSRLKDIFFITIALVFIGYVWRDLPQMVMRSDGFVHILEKEQQRFWGQHFWVGGYEINASLFGALLPKFFGANVESYLWFEWAFILLLSVVFYIVVRVVTKESYIALFSTIIASVGYFGNWDMYGTHCYCFFLERVTNVPFIFFAFLFLHLYLVKKRFYLLISSYLLFFLGLKFGHLALLLTPPFFLYVFWWFVMNSKKQLFWKGLVIGSIYIGISASIVWIQQLAYPGWFPQEWTFSEFILKGAYFKVIGFLLTNWSQYFTVIPQIFTNHPLRNVDLTHTLNAMPYVLSFYILVFVLLFKKLPKYRTLLLTCLTSFAGITILSSYVRFSEVFHTDSNRYTYYSNFFLSIFWGIAVWKLFFNSSIRGKIAGVFILLLFILINIKVINHVMNQNKKWNKSTKALFDYVLETRNTLKPSTLVVVSYPEFWVQEADFFTEQLGYGQVEYETLQTNMGDWRRKIPLYENVIILEYDSMCDCVRKNTIK